MPAFTFWGPGCAAAERDLGTNSEVGAADGAAHRRGRAGRQPHAPRRPAGVAGVPAEARTHGPSPAGPRVNSRHQDAGWAPEGRRRRLPAPHESHLSKSAAILFPGLVGSDATAPPQRGGGGGASGTWPRGCIKGSEPLYRPARSGRRGVRWGRGAVGRGCSLALAAGCAPTLRLGLELFSVRFSL